MSLREFLVHLSMVTVGILIAVGLEQSVEVYHHHELAAEARENMISEIADNKKELDEHVAGLDKLKKERESDIDVIDQMLTNKDLKEAHLELHFTGATLNSASWTTATTLGALVYMGYTPVKQFAQIYRKQEFYDRLQDEEVKNVQVALGMMTSFNGPQKPPGEELRAMRAQLLQSDAALVVLQQLGRQLTDDYAKVLPRKESK